MLVKVLVVDDERSIRNLVCELLTRQGYEVATASNGREGLVRVGEVDPDLIVTDIVMPDMEGIEFLSQLQKDRPGVPVIVMSGNAVGMSFLETAQVLGATGTLRKPFSKDELLDEVKRQLTSI